MSYLEHAKRAIARADDPSAEGPPAVHGNGDAERVLEIRQEFVAVRLYSRLLDRDLWLARDNQTAAELAVECPGVPVLTFSEVRYLNAKPPELLQAVLDTKAQFPGARLWQ